MEKLKINLIAQNLLNNHIFIVFEKEKETKEVDFSNQTIVKPFEKTM
jgi:hypothetical protein